MTHLIHRNLRRAPPLAVSAHGLLLRDSHGNEYIDAGGGAAVCSLGYGHPDVLYAMHRQIDRLAWAHSAFFSSDAAEELAARLVAEAPPGIGGACLVGGGSEAMEAALKLARQYFVEVGEAQRTVFIARRQAWHGGTLGALALGGDIQRRAPFAPLLMDVPRVAPCYEYRGRRGQQSVEDYTAALLDELETAFLKAGPGKVAAFCAETVAGATGGAIPPTPGYFRGVRELCDRYGILFIADEVMCGMGRTGALYAIGQEQVAPDIIAIGKGLGAGYQPIGAVLARDRIVERLANGGGAFLHGQSCSGHPVAAAAALAVLRVIERDGLLAQVQKRGATLRRMLGDVFGKHAHVGDIRGRGLLMALELVQDRASKQPFAPERKLHAAIRTEAMANGLVVYPMGGTIDGRSGDVVLLAPPFIATAADLMEIVARLADALEAALRH
jgi:adenosylmethionine-8-amino-7-oxononanoate aminotransferase